MPSIPSSVKIVYGDYRELILDQFNVVHGQWSIDSLNKRHPGAFIFRKLNVLDCTVVDGKNKASLKTAIARHTNTNTWDPVTQKYVATNIAAQVDDRMNGPIPDLELLSYEYGSHGSITYKVLTKEKYYLDLAPEMLIDIGLNSEIKNGFLNCNMIWAFTRRRLRLIREGSDLHHLILQGIDV